MVLVIMASLLVCVVTEPTVSKAVTLYVPATKPFKFIADVETIGVVKFGDL